MVLLALRATIGAAASAGRVCFEKTRGQLPLMIINISFEVLVSAPGLIAWFRKDDWVDGTKDVDQVMVHECFVELVAPG